MIAWIDTETTGLDANDNDIVDLAIILENKGEIVSTFERKMRPFKIENVSLKALEVNGLTLEQIKTFPDPEFVYQELISWLDQFETMFTFAGHNAAFDKKFVHSFFVKNHGMLNFASFFKPKNLCTLQLAYEVKRQLPTRDCKLGTLAKHFGIAFDGDAHTAMADAKVAMELHKYLVPIAEKGLQMKMNLSQEVKGFIALKEKYLRLEYVIINPDGEIYITKKATENKRALNFILKHLYNLHQ